MNPLAHLVRTLTMLALAALLAACGISDRSQLVGEYQANWNQAEQLTLRPDGTYLHRYTADGEAATQSGRWETSSGNIDRISLYGFQSGHPGATRHSGTAISAPQVYRTLGNDIVISMNADRNLAFVKQ